MEGLEKLEASWRIAVHTPWTAQSQTLIPLEEFTNEPRKGAGKMVF